MKIKKAKTGVEKARWRKFFPKVGKFWWQA